MLGGGGEDWVLPCLMGEVAHGEDPGQAKVTGCFWSWKSEGMLIVVFPTRVRVGNTYLENGITGAVVK